MARHLVRSAYRPTHITDSCARRSGAVVLQAGDGVLVLTSSALTSGSRFRPCVRSGRRSVPSPWEDDMGGSGGARGVPPAGHRPCLRFDTLGLDPLLPPGWTSGRRGERGPRSDDAPSRRPPWRGAADASVPWSARVARGVPLPAHGPARARPRSEPRLFLTCSRFATASEPVGIDLIRPLLQRRCRKRHSPERPAGPRTHTRG